MNAAAELGADRCRACLGGRMIDFLDLGLQPIANRYVAADERDQPEPAFPLRAHVCLDCALIQVPNRVPAEFFRHYLYTPAAADGLRRHFAALADRLVDGARLPADGYLVDIGCNEGVLLAACAARGLRVLGIDPARNLIARARAAGLEVVGEYFDGALARALRARRGPAAAITTTNTFNHIDDLHGFVGGVRELLAADGVFIVEVPHAADLIAHNEFDTIYHEHLSEFSVRAIVELYRACGLQVFDVEALPVHGGSLRVWGQHAAGPRPTTAAVARALADEERRGLFAAATYAAFRQRVEALREALRERIASVRADGGRVAAYGAPAKGMTLLAYCGLGATDIAYVADRNPLKQGRFTPGTGIPIVPAERIADDPPDVLLVLAWNFLDEILAQQAAFRRRGGRFLVPIPTPRFVEPPPLERARA
ncbi:class I SAM-dependent methyltransferase [bacterium]|nr:class I SAM-dependent methyltransferase [bacterium]